MQISIVAGSGVPIFRQIADQIIRAIATGKLAVGDSVPSVRQLAKELVINPNTVAKVYEQSILLTEYQSKVSFLQSLSIITDLCSDPWVDSAI